MPLKNQDSMEQLEYNHRIMEPRRCSRVDPVTEQACQNSAYEKHRWCKVCVAKYKREYTALLPGMATMRGWYKGADALKAVLITEFTRLGVGQFSGDDVAYLIAQCPVPKPDQGVPTLGETVSVPELSS